MNSRVIPLFFMTFMIQSICFSVQAGSVKIYGLRELYEGRDKLMNSTVNVIGRMNTHPNSEPTALMTLSDLNDPYGYTKKLLERKKKYKEFIERNPGKVVNFPIINVSPLEALYGPFNTPDIYKIEEKIESVVGVWEGKCVVIFGFLLENEAHERRKEKKLFARIIPISIRLCE